MLKSEEKRELLEIARKSIALSLEDGQIYSEEPGSSRLKESGAAFVTLKKSGMLRGCIGHIMAREPLYVSVRDMAIKASFDDSRFRPLTKEEWPQISIEISVIGPLVPVKKPDDIKIGRDGLYIKQGLAGGLLLPQVAAEYGWNTEKFLCETCEKAGLPETAWKNTTTTIYRFEAEVFGENDKII